MHCTHTHHLDTMFTGVLQLKDLPALMSEARADAEARDDEVSFVLGSVAHTRNGDMLTDDDVSDAVSVDVSTRGGGELAHSPDRAGRPILPSAGSAAPPPAGRRIITSRRQGEVRRAASARHFPHRDAGGRRRRSPAPDPWPSP